MARRKSYKRKKKGFFKRNWDLVIGIIFLLIALFFGLYIFYGCYDWGCLGLLLPIMIGVQAYTFIIMPIAIFRSIKNKGLNKLRWIFIFVLPFLFLIALILFTRGDISKSVEVYFNMLNPIIIFKFFGKQSFSIIEGINSPNNQLFLNEVLQKNPQLNQTMQKILGLK